MANPPQYVLIPSSERGSSNFARPRSTSSLSVNFSWADVRVAQVQEALCRPYSTTGSRYVPKISLSAAQISPSVALAFTASIR